MGSCIQDQADVPNQELLLQFQTTKLDRSGNIVDKFQTPDNRPQDSLGFDFNPEQQVKEEFMAVKPWIGALVQPSNGNLYLQAPQFNRNAPDKNLTLSYVNGFKCQDSRSNLYFLQNGDIVFAAASLGITQKILQNKQQYFGGGNVKNCKGHNDDIMSLGICPQRKLVATGDLGKKPRVYIWQAQSKNIVSTFNLGRNTRAISILTFSNDGKHVFLGDKHNQHNAYLFNLDGKLVSQCKTGSDPFLNCCSGDNLTFCTVSKGGALFYRMKDNQLEDKRNLFGSHKRTGMACCSFVQGRNNFITGGFNGQIYFWGFNSCNSSRKLHNGSIMAIKCGQDKILTSGYDRKLKVLNVNLQEISSYQLPKYATSLDIQKGLILVGTRNGIIKTISQKGQENIVLQAHWTGQAWGLAYDKQSDLVLTSGDDNTVKCFDPKSNKVISEGIINEVRGKKRRIGGASSLSLLPPNQQCRAVAINEVSGNVALATNQGGLSIRMSVKQLNSQVAYRDNAKQWIQVMKYSPDFTKLAVGSHDNNIYIYQVTFSYQTKQYNLLTVCKAHNSFITNLDWSLDGNSIQSNCGAYEYLFFQANSGSQKKSGASQLRDQQWATYSVKLGWYVQGVFPPAMDGTHVNGVSRSNDKSMFCVCDDWGLVNLYRNPCLKGSYPRSFRAHSSHVVRGLWDNSDSRIFSIGGYDKCLMIWKVE